MSEEVLSRITSELGAIEYQGRLSYHFYNEPLLRKDLERIVAKVKKEVPNCHQILYSNGDYLTEQRYDSLRQAGVELFVITSHSGKEHPPREYQVVQFSTDLELTNRGGALKHLPPSEGGEALKCFAPAEMLIVTVTGDVVLCYEDAFRKHIMGNILTHSLSEIWFGEKFVKLRASLLEGDRSVTEICRKCSNKAHTVEGQSAHSEPFWKEMNISW
jgi:2-deoxy-scyllo-inosamine dehydrogenase (SAM-dependent)